MNEPGETLDDLEKQAVEGYQKYLASAQRHRASKQYGGAILLYHKALSFAMTEQQDFECRNAIEICKAMIYQITEKEHGSVGTKQSKG